MKILVFTAMHRRPLISELFCMSMQRLQRDNPDVELLLYAVVSEDKQSEDVCQKYGWLSYTYKNLPLGNKWNTGLSWATAHADFDYVMIMGSDDIMSSELLKKIISYRYMSRTDYFGVQSLFFLSVEKSEAVQFFYPNQKLVGCCRFISKRAINHAALQVRVVMEKDFLTYKKNSVYFISAHKAEYLRSVKHATIIGIPEFRLWNPELNQGLDMSSELTLVNEGFFPRVLRTHTPMVTDVKTDNINPYEYVRGAGEQVSVQNATAFFSDNEKDVLRLMGTKL